MMKNMKRYIKPTIREVYIDTEEEVLDVLMGMSGNNKAVKLSNDGYEDMSKGNDGWDCWDEE